MSEDYGILKFVKNGNIVRITRNKERFVAIVNSVPKHVIDGTPKNDPTMTSYIKRKKTRNGEINVKEDCINVSTQFDNHLSSVLQRKHLKEVELNLSEIKVGFITLDEYKEIEEVIFQPNMSSEVRTYWNQQKKSNVKFIKRVLKGKGSILGSMGKRPADTVFEPKILTTEYESSLNKAEIQRKMRRNTILQKAMNQKKDPIEQYKLKQKMEKLKLNRNAQRRINEHLKTDQKTKEPI